VLRAANNHRQSRFAAKLVDPDDRSKNITVMIGRRSGLPQVEATMAGAAAIEA